MQPPPNRGDCRLRAETRRFRFMGNLGSMRAVEHARPKCYAEYRYAYLPSEPAQDNPALGGDVRRRLAASGQLPAARVGAETRRGSLVLHWRAGISGRL